MIAVQFISPQVSITPTPDGGKVIEFIDQQTGIRVGVQMGADEVGRLRAALSGVEVPASGRIPTGRVGTGIDQG